MTTVRIAQFKARLSHYLRLVQRGETLVVCHRNTPVARILPPEFGHHRLTITEPKPGSPRFHEVPLPPPANLGFDIVDFLMEDREKR